MRSGPLRPLLVLALALEITAGGLAPGTVLAAGRHRPPAIVPPAPPAPFVVAIDPGHGGSYSPAHPRRPWDPGAISPFNGLVERVVTLGEGLDLRTLLQAQGVRVVMTRTSDVFVSIPDAEAIVDRSRANLFVSLWVNDWFTRQVEGATVFTPHPGDTAFAERIDAGLAAAIAPYGMVNRGIQPRPDLWVHAPMPTVTIEAGFMSDRKDSLLLAQPAVRLAIARGIDDGIVAYAPQIRRLRTEQAAYRSQLARYHAAVQTRERARRAAAARARAARRRARFDPLLWLAAVLLVAGVYRRFLLNQARRMGRARAAAAPVLTGVRTAAIGLTRLGVAGLRLALSQAAPSTPSRPSFAPRRVRRRRRRRPPARRWRVPGLPTAPSATRGPAFGPAVALGGRAPRRRVVDQVQPAEPVRHRRTVYDELWP
ncbi:MAG TPA: N-acetylmuramoyl-L-alanine amidase [Candidatus Micrarchaeia archaeon]|nr:N-acetylmuramoyl-L-alanine amidase [Candidatus Micrarchaeia archaeon]